MDILSIFGSSLRARRLQCGLSQEELAHLAGVSVGYLSQVENGHRNPSLLLAAALAGALKADLADLLKAGPGRE